MQEIIIFNSITKSKQPLKTKTAGLIQMYVCGMTVYDNCHIGHARLMMFFDTIQAIFQHFNYQVNYVRNITDIDDKIIQKALEQNTTWQEITTKFIHKLNQDTETLNMSKPNFEPKATENIQPIIQLIQTLLDKKHAYIAKDNDVYFAVKSFNDYGKLSKQNLSAINPNTRKELSKDKQDSLDFILWKQAKPNEPSWNSPWGKGRPGWHIECSAMAHSFIGNNIDIHGGGIDLKFPHHENEIAQSEAAYCTNFVNCWMHVGHVMVDSIKMSKSLGNFSTVEDITSKFHPEVVRYFLLTTHYRSPLNFTLELMQQAKQSLLTLYHAIDLAENTPINSSCKIITEFETAITDDFNLPQAFAICFKTAKEIKATPSPKLATSLKQCLNILKLGNYNAQIIQQHNQKADNEAIIQQLIAQRAIAKKNKNWELADKIRNDLLKQNIVLEDYPDNTSWRHAS